MKSLAWFSLAAVAEIAGCYAFWMWLRLNKGALPLVFGLPALLLFAYALTRIDTDHAGRAYAAYSAIYLGASLIWMKVVEGVSPDRWDITGAGLCLAGAAVIIFMPR